VRGRALLVLALAAASARAQAATDAPAQPIVRASDGGILGVALAGSLLLMPYDVQITAWKGLPPFRNSAHTRATLDATAFIGGPGSLMIDAVMFGAGRIANNKNFATDGEAAFEAAAVGGAVTFLLKRAIGRARPGLDSTRADDFGFGRGFFGGSDYQSFPSGHTTAAFAFATAITARLGQRNSSSVNWAAPVLFSVATLTGIQRVYSHAHWASDCLMGAAIGTVSGLAAARWHQQHP
jgi:membrane-associated phospholipid phosphatase